MADEALARVLPTIKEEDKLKTYYYLHGKDGVLVSETSVEPSPEVAAKFDIHTRVGKADPFTEVWNPDAKEFEAKPAPVVSQDVTDSDVLIAADATRWTPEQTNRALQLVLTGLRKGIR